ncbi:uncharacterized protein J4E92_002216 [Alternaria infectoria]|uniref:uncharacterized protein n=1 Tax=Alternaria infectoria TaxID=45303 RepID=UPI00221F5809|nr:uncharacterized protein J4E92_002216 [Alternaria infectoria]KAI4937485.1 hypothetical protein J4E92_002216 [Alternaria infectoria]
MSGASQSDGKADQDKSNHSEKPGSSFHFEMSDEYVPHGDRNVFRQHASAGSSVGGLSGQRALPSMLEWPFVTSDPKFVTIPPINPGGSIGNQASQTPPTGLFGQSPGFQGDGPLTAFPTSSSSEKGTFEVATEGEFMDWIKPFLELDDKAMKPIALDLRQMHSSIVTLVSKVRRVGEAIAEARAAIERTDQRMIKLQKEQAEDEEHGSMYRAALTSIRTQLGNEEAVLRSHQRKAEILRSRFTKNACVPLQTFITQHKSLLSAKCEETDRFRREHLDSHKRLGVTEKSLNTAQDEVKKLKNELSTARKQVASTTENNQKLEQQNARLVKENTDLKNVKEATDETCKDLITDNELLVDYKEGYPQLQKELGRLQYQTSVLQGEYNDAIAERDDLQKRLDAMTLATNSRSNSAASDPLLTTPNSNMPAPISELDRLDGQEKHFENRLNAKLASNEKKKAEIISLDAKIEQARRRLESPL